MDGPGALQRFVFERESVRGELVRLDETWREVRRRREYPEAVRSALGELTAASVLLAATLTRAELLELPARDILRRLFHDEDLRLFETMPVRFACRCSRERVAGLIRMLGADEVRQALADARGRTPQRAGA